MYTDAVPQQPTRINHLVEGRDADDAAALPLGPRHQRGGEAVLRLSHEIDELVAKMSNASTNHMKTVVMHHYMGGENANVPTHRMRRRRWWPSPSPDSAEHGRIYPFSFPLTDLVPHEVDVRALPQHKGVRVAEGVAGQGIRRGRGEVPPLERALHQPQRRPRACRVVSCCGVGWRCVCGIDTYTHMGTQLYQSVRLPSCETTHDRKCQMPNVSPPVCMYVRTRGALLLGGVLGHVLGYLAGAACSK